MKAKSAANESLLLYCAILAMAVLIFAISFLTYGSILQKSLILLGAFVLFVVASMGKQKVLQALQLVIVIGAVLGFLQLSMLYSLSLMLFVSILMVIYLISIEHYKKEPIGAMGSAGFLLLAIGLAFNTGSNNLVTWFSLGFGAVLIAVYSATAFWLYKVRLQLVWVLLNLAFAISPLLLFFSSFGI
ncbi:MAG: hypothetical protein M1348_02930 [Candidatus Parvarchaeota archaeon]|jgi:hypothetical protein|nr:hypothetical protein [Candidatus Parvarchaeota archaeon]MCL5101539.1 hypothetical protein [Candidatus Parvarchaeota archaeon]